jgi:hypothetical protein
MKKDLDALFIEKYQKRKISSYDWKDLKELHWYILDRHVFLVYVKIIQKQV